MEKGSAWVHRSWHILRSVAAPNVHRGDFREDHEYTKAGL